MRRLIPTLIAVVLVTVPATQGPGSRWWAHVRYLASDALQGRDTGSAGHRVAAEYVAGQFRAIGLRPAGTKGYFQPVLFKQRRIDESRSRLAIVRAGNAFETLTLGDDATIGLRNETPSKQPIEAPIVFAGYGLQIPETRRDDLAGLNLKGKVVLLVTGGPASIPGPLLAHYQSTRWSYLKKAGAIGVLAIRNPKGQDIPWERSKLARFQPFLALADPALDETQAEQIEVTINPASAEKVFAGSGHTGKEILALVEAGRDLPRFEIPGSIRATIVVRETAVESDNVAAVLAGRDPKLKDEFVVVTAHLDHVGKGEPINGDAIYNGAMDNASGIATLIETAAAAAAAKGGFRRSILFVAVTAEEKGLLGSRYFANHPTVPRQAIVANLNTDMFLPIFPLRSVIAQGLEESDLADDLRRAAGPLKVQVLSDPEPERNAFVRSDQYSFIKVGIPALSLKNGYTKGSAEQEIVRRWRTERYHAPSDDLSQPVNLQAADDFNRFYLALVGAVADRPNRPRWYEGSFFGRFVQK
jgi:Zn-dependent M28 family amino/carboxypeptidase